MISDKTFNSMMVIIPMVFGAIIPPIFYAETYTRYNNRITNIERELIEMGHIIKIGGLNGEEIFIWSEDKKILELNLGG